MSDKDAKWNVSSARFHALQTLIDEARVNKRKENFSEALFSPNPVDVSQEDVLSFCKKNGENSKIKNALKPFDNDNNGIMDDDEYEKLKINIQNALDRGLNEIPDTKAQNNTEKTVKIYSLSDPEQQRFDAIPAARHFKLPDFDTEQQQSDAIPDTSKEEITISVNDPRLTSVRGQNLPGVNNNGNSYSYRNIENGAKPTYIGEISSQEFSQILHYLLKRPNKNESEVTSATKSLTKATGLPAGIPGEIISDTGLSSDSLSPAAGDYINQVIDAYTSDKPIPYPPPDIENQIKDILGLSSEVINQSIDALNSGSDIPSEVANQIEDALNLPSGLINNFVDVWNSDNPSEALCAVKYITD